MTAGKQSDSDPVNNKQTSNAASKKQMPPALRVRRPFGTTRFSSPPASDQALPAGQVTGEIHPETAQALFPEPAVPQDSPAPLLEVSGQYSSSTGITSALEELAKLAPPAAAKNTTHLPERRRLLPLEGELPAQQTKTTPPAGAYSSVSTDQYISSTNTSEGVTPVIEKPSDFSNPTTPFPFNRIPTSDVQMSSNPVTPLPVAAPWLSNLSAGIGTGSASVTQEFSKDTRASSSSSKKDVAKTTPLHFQTGNSTGQTPVQNTPVSQANPTTLLPETNQSLTVRLPESSFTGILPMTVVDSGTTSSIKLPGPMKIVQMPVAGQPGRFVTGFLPVLPPEEAPEEPTSRFSIITKGLAERGQKQYQQLSRPLKIVGALSAALLVLAVLSSPAWLFRGANSDTSSQSQSNSALTHLSAADLQATATAQADQKNILLSDPLNMNIHNWTVANKGPRTFVFKDGAYHIFNNDTQGAIAILHDTPADLLNRPLGYSVTLQEVKGDDGSHDNTFGLVIRFTQQRKGGNTITKFYSFQVANSKDGEYQFWKYDDTNSTPWKSLWHHNFGKEFHQGQGAKNQNVFKIFADGKKFTLLLNGKQVGIVSDNSISTGEVGMLVNLKGTEIAFSGLKLTAN